MRGALRIGARFIVLLLLLAVAYGAAAFGFALLPAAGRPQQASSEPVIYVCTTLAHADILMPRRDPLIDWGALFPAVTPSGLRDDAYLAFGWGDLRFFRETPTWADVKFSTALGALLGLHETAVRVIAVMPPTSDPDCRPLVVDRPGRQVLIGHILTTLVSDEPRQEPVAQTGLEAYYLAKGRYSPLHTCNQWVADGLAAAGLPHARFAPFSFCIMWPLGAAPKSE